MGAGDELMALGRAQWLHRCTGKPVAIVDKNGQPRRSPLWQGASFLASAPCADAVLLKDGPGARPYIERHDKERFYFCSYDPRPAPFYPTKAERAIARAAADRLAPFVVIDPHVKMSATQNKRWRMAHFQDLADMCTASGIQVVQPFYGLPKLGGITAFTVADHRATVALISQAAAVVCNEGFNHHAAAMWGVPAVAPFGGFISPIVTGYETTVAFYSHAHGGDYGCGARTPCKGCRQALDAITAEMLYAALVKVLQPRKSANGSTKRPRGPFEDRRH